MIMTTMMAMIPSQSTIVMDNRSPPTPLYFTQFMNSMFGIYTERGNAFDLLSIAALPASPWHPDCFDDLDCHQNRHTSPLSVLITGYDVGVR